MTHAHDPATAALIARFGNAKPENRGSRIQPGKHVLALVSYGFKPTDDHGPILAVELEVLQSESMQPGQKVEEAFFVSKSDQKGGTYELARALAFTNALTGDAPTDSAKFAENSAKLIAPTQPGRGLVIRATAWNETKKYGKRSDKAGQTKEVVEKSWETIVDQSQQAGIRGMLDQKYPIAAPVAAPPPAQYGYAPGPATAVAPPQGYVGAPAGFAPPIDPRQGQMAQNFGAPPAGYGYPAAAPAPAPAQPAAAPAAPPAWGGWTPPR